MKKILLLVASVAFTAFSTTAMSQTFCPTGCSVDVQGNFGVIVGGGQYDVRSQGNSSGSNGGTGSVHSRTSFADSATQNSGNMTVSSNANRTRFGFDGSAYSGAASYNSIETRGANASNTNSSSSSRATGNLGYAGGGLNATGTFQGGVSLP